MHRRKTYGFVIYFNNVQQKREKHLKCPLRGCQAW